MKGDRCTPVAFGRYLAAHIPGARYVEFPGDDHLFWVIPTWRNVMDNWLEFVLGHAPSVSSERQFATVLFTDIVGSTARTAEVGDAAWREMLDSHDRIAWDAVDRHSGKLVKNTGDGLLMTLGEDGMCLIERSGSVTRIPTVAQEVFDVAGAGDTVVATFTLALASGTSMTEAARLANHAAGLVVGKLGTAVVTPQELRNRMERARGTSGARRPTARTRAKRSASRKRSFCCSFTASRN